MGIRNEYVTKALEGKGDIVIVEIGAADGADTVELASKARQMSTNGRSIVYAFEPDPRNIEVLLTRTIEFNNVIVDPRAICAETKKVRLNLSTGKNEMQGVQDWSFSNTIVEPKAHLQVYPWVKFQGAIDVPGVALDDFFERERHVINHIDLLWVDTNGGEAEVITGGINALRHTHYLFMEYDNRGLFGSRTTLWDLAHLLPCWDLLALIDNHDFIAINLLFERR